MSISSPHSGPADLLLLALHAGYVHTAISLRYLLANLGDLQARARLVEWPVRTEVETLAEDILADSPRVLLVGVYIWNLATVRRLLPVLKQRRPDLRIVLGGPEVSYAPPDEPALAWADVVVRGEGEAVVEDLCRRLLEGDLPKQAVIDAPPPVLSELHLPYALYTDEDVRHRLIYVETSRGCPYRCAYCLSACDPGVRTFPLERVLPELEQLLDRGVRLFKFLDRSFNASITHAERVLTWLLAHYRPGCVFHLEWVPDRTPDPLKQLIQQFPPGALQLETGIQSCSQEVLDRVGRRQDAGRALEHLAWLTQCPAVTVHADLIIGLPGETESQWAHGFDRVVRLAPDRVDVNLLKCLRGTPLVSMAADWDLSFEEDPPYRVLSTRDISADRIQALDRFTRLWNLFYNRGRLQRVLPLLWQDGPGPSRAFGRFSDYLFQRFGRTHGIDLLDQVRGLHDYLIEHLHRPQADVIPVLAEAYADGRRRILPAFLRSR